MTERHQPLANCAHMFYSTVGSPQPRCDKRRGSLVCNTGRKVADCKPGGCPDHEPRRKP